MTTIRELIQTSPARANELFAKLVDTSDTAVKTRDRLFLELKVELDRQALLEEQHLFPVLKKHEETRSLVADALNDNRQTRKLLGELERTPTDSEAFGAKVAELRKVFQQHVRDDKKEFLPAVVKALSAEEASTIVGKIEDEKASIAAAQRSEAEERRADAKREREQVDAARAATDKAKAAERARKNNEAAKAKASAAARNAKIEADRVEAARREASRIVTADAKARTADVVKSGARVARDVADTARRAAAAGAGTVVEMRKPVRAVARAGTTQAPAAETGTAPSITALFGEQLRHAMDAALAIGSARTLADAAGAQSDFIRGSYYRMTQINERCLVLVGGGIAPALLPPSRG